MIYLPELHPNRRDCDRLRIRATLGAKVPPEWFNFYKAFELMREDINQRLGGQHRQEQIGWPAKDILDHFTCSAQVYRHSPAKWPQGYSPANAMHLREATQFIQSCAATWLAWRFP